VPATLAAAEQMPLLSLSMFLEEPAGTYLEALSIFDVQLQRLESYFVMATAPLIARHIEACSRNVDNSAGRAQLPANSRRTPIEHESEKKYNQLNRH